MWRSVPTAKPKVMHRRQLNPAHKHHQGPREPLSHCAETHAAIASFRGWSPFPNFSFQTPNQPWPPQPWGADKILRGTISKNSSELSQGGSRAIKAPSQHHSL